MRFFLFKNLLLNWPLLSFVRLVFRKFRFFPVIVSDIAVCYTVCVRYTLCAHCVNWTVRQHWSKKFAVPGHFSIRSLAPPPSFLWFSVLAHHLPLGILKFSGGGGGVSSRLIRLFGFDRVIMWKMSSRREVGWQEIRCLPIPFMPRSSICTCILLYSPPPCELPCYL